MDLEIYTAPGCLRCKVAKSFLAEQGREFAEIDMMGDGQDAFARFYREHRGAIHRGPEGLEFPILWTGGQVVQGVGEILAWAQAGDGLAGFVSRSELLHGWIDGLSVSGGDPALAEDFLAVLRHLKTGGLTVQLTANGGNPDLLAACRDEGLAERLIMTLLGPVDIYAAAGIAREDVEKTLALLSGFGDYIIRTVVGPMVRADGSISLLTHDELGAAAAWVAEVTNDRKHPYVLAAFDPARTTDERLKGQDPLPPNQLLKYRTAARRHLVKAEVEKG